MPVDVSQGTGGRRLWAHALGVFFEAGFGPAESKEPRTVRNDKQLKKYVSAGGTTVYKLPVEAFPNHVTNCYLVMTDPVTLLDTGSGWDQSNRDLVKCFEG